MSELPNQQSETSPSAANMPMDEDSQEQLWNLLLEDEASSVPPPGPSQSVKRPVEGSSSDEPPKKAAKPDKPIEKETDKGTPLCENVKWDDLLCEWSIFKGRIKDPKGRRVRQYLEAPSGKEFPNLREIWKTILVIEPTSVRSERAWSTIKWIKNPYRSNMHDDTLWALARIHDHYEDELSDEMTKKVITFFRSGIDPWISRQSKPDK
eukprot:gene24815-10732_t